MDNHLPVTYYIQHAIVITVPTFGPGQALTEQHRPQAGHTLSNMIRTHGITQPPSVFDATSVTLPSEDEYQADDEDTSSSGNETATVVDRQEFGLQSGEQQDSAASHDHNQYENLSPSHPWPDNTSDDHPDLHPLYMYSVYTTIRYGERTSRMGSTDMSEDQDDWTGDGRAGDGPPNLHGSDRSPYDSGSVQVTALYIP